MSARVISIANSKGGVGKTTTCVSLAEAFAAEGRRTLVVDLDMQANASLLVFGHDQSPFPLPMLATCEVISSL